MTIKTGGKLPEITVKTITGDGPTDVATAEVFGGKKMVLFGVPGAFTGTCTATHLPGYLDNREEMLAKGVDAIAVVSVNDPFVMQAWAEQAGGIDKIGFIADWDGAFTRAIGMDIDLSAAALGVRSKRYSMLVEDGAVTAVNVEDNPGEVTVSGAAKMLERLG